MQLRSELATAEELRQAVDAEEVGPLQWLEGAGQNVAGFAGSRISRINRINRIEKGIVASGSP